MRLQEENGGDNVDVRAISDTPRDEALARAITRIDMPGCRDASQGARRLTGLAIEQCNAVFYLSRSLTG